VQPSSLIFLVIIAIWAAYFVQHWVRRREHLATVRSVDQFTESMRVLERRSPLPAPDLSEPQPRSYSVSPARASRPQVLVKRAAPSAAGTAEPTAADAAAASSKQAPLPSCRRARGLTFLAALTTLPVTVTLAVLAVVPWAALAAPMAAVAVVLVWMRRGAQAERAARREATRRQRAQREGRDLGEAAAHTRSGIGAPPREGRAASTRATAASARDGVELDAAAPDDSVPPAHSPVGLAADDAHADADADTDVDAVTRENADADRSAARGGLYDIQAVERAAAQVPAAAAAAAAATAAARSLGVTAPTVPAGPLVDEDDIPLTWDPVPVPRPTYTMKAMAQRHQPAPVGQGVPPELAEPAYEEPVRHVAGA
jgi:hypothetical protein